MTSENINYQIRVETGESTIEANVILCIFGNEETTTNLALKTTKDGSDAKFDKDSILEFDLQAVDVGKIKKINIGHDGKGNEQQWFLKTIQIKKKDEEYTFQANRWLSEDKDDQQTFIDLLPEGEKTLRSSPVPKKDQSTYIITIVTSSNENAGTDAGVLMTIFGDKAITKQFQLINTKQGDKAVFETGKTNEFQMELDDVGKIHQINIGQDGKGSHLNWHLESVQIQKGTENYNFLAKTTLDQSKSFIDLTPTAPQKTPSPVLVKPETPRPMTVKIETPRPVTPEPKTPSIKEITYKISYQSDSHQKETSNLYLTIHGRNDHTDKLYFKDSTVSDKKNQLEFKTIDVGKISKIVLGQEKSENEAAWQVDNITIKRNQETTTFNAEKTVQPNSEIELFPSAIPKKTETTYKILIQTGTHQEEGNDSNLSITIFGPNGQTKKIPLNDTTKKDKKIPIKKEEKIEFEFKTNDVGKISKILLAQNPDEQGIVWHINHITIKRNYETTTFNVERQLEKNSEIELIPTPLPKKTETPRKTVKTSDTISKIITKMKDADYEIIISTGDQTFQVPVTLKIRGENGTVNIPLTKTKTNEKPFQSKSTHEFTCRTNDVGKIKRITIEHQGTDQELIWHLKTIQIKKGNETYSFHANIHLDYKENKVNLYPVGAFLGHQKEDYVQSELRRLRESLRSESSKLHPPQHKAHEPFVFNDLGPYFDTSPVERAIYSPLDSPPGYYTRITALRVVEPWEAYGMDYGVSYELLKQRKNRSLSGKRPVSKSGDESVDRKQGSTHLPKFPCVNMQKPAEYSRPLTMNDVPKIRSLIRDRYTAKADNQIEKDYKRTHDDFYRMQLDNLDGYHESNRDNMVQIYHSYLENTPGSKKALRELCDRVAANHTKPSVDTTV